MEITRPLPQAQLTSPFAMPTEEDRPGMFARRAKSPFQVRRQKLTKEPPHDGEDAGILLYTPYLPYDAHDGGNASIQLSTTSPHDAQPEYIEPERSLGPRLAHMTDPEIMKILMNTARFLAEEQWGASGLGWFVTTDDKLVNSEDVRMIWRPTNPDRYSVDSQLSVVPEHPAVAEIEGTPAHPVAFGEKDLEGMIFRVNGREVQLGQQRVVQQTPVYQTPAQQQAATLASALQGPPRIVVSSAEHNHRPGSSQRRDSSGSRIATPERSPAPLPMQSKPQPTNPERRAATPAPHHPGPLSSNLPLIAATPNTHRSNPTNRRSVSDELHFPQPTPPTPQQAPRHNETQTTPTPPIRVTPSPDSYLAVPDPSFYRPRHTKNRPVTSERPPPYRNSPPTTTTSPPIISQEASYSGDTEPRPLAFVSQDGGGCRPI
jgi:hypothetical protein